MTIGIDISQIAFPGTGVAVYTANLVANLLKNGGDYQLFGSSLRQQKKFKVFPQVKIFPFPPTAMEFIWNQLHTLPVENLIGPIDIFHSSDWTQPPTKAKKITTIHDLVVYKYPESSSHTTRFRWGNFSPVANIVAAQKRRLAWVKKECDRVIAISQSTKIDIVELLGIPEEKITVVYEATNMKKGKVNSHQYKPYILAVGTQEPRKNIGRLIQAFQKLKNKDVDLVVVGKYGWGDKNLKFEIRNLKMLGYVPNEELADLYTNASVFVYPSLYEGFGIPILEALNCDCPVITSNVSSLPEVGGKAAIYIDPLNVSDITEKIDWVLSLPTSKRSALVKLGNDQAAKFSWEKASIETKKVYESLI